MRKITIIIAFISTCTYAQTHELVNDTLISKLMQVHVDSYQLSNKKKKIISDTSVLWNEADLGSYRGYKAFDHQLSNIISADEYIYSDKKEKFTQLFDPEDLSYMKEQFDNETTRIWNFKSIEGKIKKNPRRNFYLLSQPLFSKTKQKAMIYQEMRCGSLCGGGIIYIYIREADTWKLYTRISLWTS